MRGVLERAYRARADPVDHAVGGEPAQHSSTLLGSQQFDHLAEQADLGAVARVPAAASTQQRLDGPARLRGERGERARHESAEAHDGLLQRRPVAADPLYERAPVAMANADRPEVAVRSHQRLWRGLHLLSRLDCRVDLLNSASVSRRPLSLTVTRHPRRALLDFATPGLSLSQVTDFVNKIRSQGQVSRG